MTKRVFLVHGWGGSPDGDWLPWLKKMLIEMDIETIVPAMPDTNNPHIKTWIPYLSNVVGKADGNTYFVGHSIGCQAIMRYLETLDSGVKVGGAVFIAGFFQLKTLDENESQEIEREWTKTPIDLEVVRSHLDKSTAIFSDNDPYVLLSDSKRFEKELGSKIIIHPNRGHFTSSDNVTELHVALNEILKMTKD